MPTGTRRGSIGHVQDITEGMRAILVDWLVEVQESFELNHETLYTAVKLMDLYLSKVRFLVNLKSFKVDTQTIYIFRYSRHSFSYSGFCNKRRTATGGSDSMPYCLQN